MSFRKVRAPVATTCVRLVRRSVKAIVRVSRRLPAGSLTPLRLRQSWRKQPAVIYPKAPLNPGKYAENAGKNMSVLIQYVYSIGGGGGRAIEPPPESICFQFVYCPTLSVTDMEIWFSDKRQAAAGMILVCWRSGASACITRVQRRRKDRERVFGGGHGLRAAIESLQTLIHRGSVS